MKPSFSLTISTPESSISEKDVESLVIPRKDGFFGILANHAPLTSTVAAGIIKISREKKVEYVFVGDGLLEARANRVHILCDAFRKVGNLSDAFDLLEQYTGKMERPAVMTERMLSLK